MTTYSDPESGYRNGGILYSGEEFPELLLAIGNERYTPLPGTLRAAEAVSERATCSFELLLDDADEIKKDMPVTVRKDGARLFSGVVNKPKARSPGHDHVIVEVDCVDHQRLAERRLVARSYLGPISVGDIVRDLLAVYLAEDGVFEGIIEEGPEVTEAVFNYVYLDEALDAMADESGYFWRINGGRQLDFRSRGSQVAPFTLDDIEEWADDASIEERNEQYRNRQYLRGGKGETETQTEKLTVGTGGEQETVTTRFPIARAPTVTLNGNPQSVGIRGIDDDANRDFYWSRGSPVLSYGPPGDEGTISAGDEVVVQYIGMFDIVVVATNQAEVEERQEIETTGTGLVEHVETRPEINTTGAAFELAAGLLSNYGRIGRHVNFKTERAGLRAGQLLTATVPAWNVEQGEFLIQSVEAETLGSTVVFTVDAYEGPLEGTWTKFFKKMQQQPDPLVFRENIDENEVLVLLESVTETTGLEEDVQIATFSCHVTGFTDDEYVDATITYADASQAYRGDLQDVLYVAANEGDYVDDTVTYADSGEGYRGTLATGEEVLYPC